MKIRSALIALLLWPAARCGAQSASQQLIHLALSDSSAYTRLTQLTDKFGARPSGSRSLEDAIDWIVAQMRRDGFDSVYTEPVQVTHWVRGNERAELLAPRRVRLHMLGLGRSVATPPQGITAHVLVVRDFAELRARSSEARGSIVVFNAPFDTTINPFWAYGAVVQYRAYGVDSAAAVGAVAALVRSATPHSLSTPHTGGLSWADTVRNRIPIPGASISVEDAELLARLQEEGQHPVVHLTMSAQTLPLAPSRNIIAEIRGVSRPHEFVVIGGHIDSWDVGTGAMDDGGGSVAAWEAARLLLRAHMRPARTIRVVLFTNEELGLSGALAYRDRHSGELKQHVLAMESDNGVFRPRGLLVSADSAFVRYVKSIAGDLKEMGASNVIESGPEADVSFLNAVGVPFVGVDTDPTRYFWYHHTEADTVDKLDPRDLALCVAAYGVIAYQVANKP